MDDSVLSWYLCVSVCTVFYGWLVGWLILWGWGLTPEPGAY
jgi:hypothetical protein